MAHPAAGFLPLVSVGLHQALTPIHVMLNDPAGPTTGVNYLLPVLMMSGGGQVGAGLALYLRTRNKKLKGYIRDSIPVGILGVGEPLMYAVTLPLGRPFVTACLSAGVGGMLATLFHLGAISQGVSGLFGVLIVQPGQQVTYVVSLVGACAGGFVLTWLFGVDDQRIEELYGA
ncbi:MAG: PTS transporter subunit EIIC [Atopobiaceae bacterium]|nr:PTS transporter subunit EIIC [Atopobiaceae bacterium]